MASATTKENIQWTINDIFTNRAINKIRDEQWIDLVRAVEFREYGPDESPAAIPPLDNPNTVPTVEPCKCKYCKKGTFRWDYSGATRKFVISKSRNMLTSLLCWLTPLAIICIVAKNQFFPHWP